MKNIKEWQPSKYDIVEGKILPTKNVKELHIASRFVVSLSAKFYSEKIPQYAKGSLLDLGCGKVPLYGFYKDYVNEVTCVDWDNTTHTNLHIDFCCDLNGKLEFAQDNTFDTIILSSVLEHIREPEMLVSEMNRILKKNGIILFNVPFFYWLHETPYDYFRYTEYALKLMFEKNNFEILELEATGGGIDVITDIMAKMLVINNSCFRKKISVFLQNLSLSFGKTKYGKRLRKRTERLFPVGYFSVLRKK